jgi:hypothetical protein
MVRKNPVDFFFENSNYEEILQKVKEYYKEEFNQTIDIHNISFPEVINEQQAKYFKETMELSFHDIVEYDDDEELDPDNFNLKEQELDEF